MIRITFFLLILLFNTKIISAKDFFNSKFYEIQFTSENVEEYKKNKLTDIKFETILEIFSKILINEDYNSIKNNISEDLINTFIKNIIISDEKIINNNYYSNVKINFDKKKIIDYLRNKSLSYVEYVPEKFLTIIYEEKDLSNNTLSNNNSYYNYLIKNKNLFEFYKIPDLDINDRYLLNTNDIKYQNIDKLKNFIKKYDENTAVIIISKQINSSTQYTIYYYSDGKILQINNYELNNIEYKSFFQNLKSEIIDYWKINNSIQNNFLNILTCKVSFFNLNELKEIKSNLRKTSIVKKIILKKISYQNNFYEFSYYGDSDILYKLLIMNNLKIKLDNNNCKISLK